MYTIEALLHKKPYRSSVIVEMLVKQDGISPEAARKRLSRAKFPVLNLKNISLPNRELIYYHVKHVGTTIFSKAISEILIQTNSALGRALIGLKTAKGAIPLSLFATISGTASDNRTTKHSHYTKVLKEIEELDIIRIKQGGSGEEIVCFNGLDDIPSKQKATLIVEDIVLSIIQKWLADLGIGSYNKISIREQSPKFGVFSWDIVGPCYLNGLVSYNNRKPIPGFVVGDILLDREVNTETIKPFIYKFDSLNHMKNIRPFISLFIADYYTTNALDELKKRGIIIARPKTILGLENAELISELIKSIDNASTTIKSNPDEFFNNIKKINKIEGAALNLRSVVLDFLLARIYSLQGFNCDIRRKIQDKNGDRAEIDVYAERVDSIICIEGKALAPGNELNANDIKIWMEKSFPRIMGWLKNDGMMDRPINIEFYTSTEYSKDAIELIDEIKRKNTRITIEFLNSKDIIKKLRALRQKALIEIFNEQFV